MDAAAMGLAMQQLQQHMIAMQQHRADDIHRHAEEIRLLRADAAAAAAAAAAHALPMGAMMRLPPAALYDGYTPPLDEWLSAMRQQYAWYGWVGDADRIRAGSAHLAGPALEWWQHLLPAALPTTLTLFEAGLKARFQPVTSAETARTKLLSLTQGRTSINDYVSTFRRLLLSVPDTDAETLKHLFLRGLNDRTREMLRASGVATLDAAITMAVRVGTPMPADAGAPPAASSASDPMDLNAMNVRASVDAPVMHSELTLLLAAMQHKNNYRGGAAAPGLSRPSEAGFTPQRLEEYMNAYRCFGCHETGHGLRACPLRKVNADGSVTWSTQ
jgi:hypothetical protein